MNRAWSPKAAIRGGLVGFEADQFQNIGHRDQFTDGPEINAWHKCLRPGHSPRTEKRKPYILEQAKSLSCNLQLKWPKW
jgi:hypothetical protein